MRLETKKEKKRENRQTNGKQSASKGVQPLYFKRKVQNKATEKCHFKPTRMATVRKMGNNKKSVRMQFGTSYVGGQI